MLYETTVFHYLSCENKKEAHRKRKPFFRTK